jgi:hypothetical protein
LYFSFFPVRWFAYSEKGSEKLPGKLSLSYPDLFALNSHLPLMTLPCRAEAFILRTCATENARRSRVRVTTGIRTFKKLSLAPVTLPNLRIHQATFCQKFR